MNIKVGRYSRDEGSVRPVPKAEALFSSATCFDTRNINGVLTLRCDRDTPLPEGFEDGEHVANVEQRWQGWIEDEEQTWIAFIDMQGKPVFFLNRCNGCHGVLTGDEPHPDGMPGYCLHHHPDGTPWTEAERDTDA